MDWIRIAPLSLIFTPCNVSIYLPHFAHASIHRIFISQPLSPLPPRPVLHRAYPLYPICILALRSEQRARVARQRVHTKRAAPTIRNTLNGSHRCTSLFSFRLSNVDTHSSPTPFHMRPIHHIPNLVLFSCSPYALVICHRLHPHTIITPDRRKTATWTCDIISFYVAL